MRHFEVNEFGGVDVCLEDGEIVVRLNADELKEIYVLQQKKNDLDFVKGRIPEWVSYYFVSEEEFFSDFNSHLFSQDEISQDDICEWILGNAGLIEKIADEYRDILEDPETEEGCQEWWYADEAISTHVSIKDIMGEILREKYPKELLVGQWRVLLVEQGDLFGIENRVPWVDSQPLVEFYDMSADKERYPEGRFTTGRFYLDKLLNPGMFDESLEEMVEQDKGLKLNQVRLDWTVLPGDLNVIASWLKAVQMNAHEKVQTKIADVIANAQSRSLDKVAPAQAREQVME